MTVPPGIINETHHDDPAMILILEPQKAALKKKPGFRKAP